MQIISLHKSLKGNCIVCFLRVKWVKVHRTEYKAPCPLVVGIQDDGLFPKFAKVHAILVMDSKVYFHTQVLTTVEYSEHFNSYIVVAKVSYHCLS